MLTTLASYRLITRNLDRSIETISKRPEVRREVDYYLAHIKSIKSVDDFMKDQRIYRFALEASGLGDMIYAKAFIRKLLEQGIEKPEALANKLADPRFREFVRRYNFASYGGTATTFDRARQGAVDDYLRLKLEAEAGEQNEGVRLALYFRRKAPQIKNGYAILADRALMKVAEVIVGHSLAHGSVDRNAELIEKRLPLKDFKDPQKLEKFLTRFAALWEINGGGAAGAGPLPAAAGLVMPGPIETGVSLDVLQALQKIKPGGF